MRQTLRPGTFGLQMPSQLGRTDTVRRAGTAQVRPGPTAADPTHGWYRRITGSLIGVLVALVLAAPAQAKPTSAASIVQLRPGTSLAQGARLIRAVGGRPTGRLPIIRAVVARLSARGVAALRRDPRVWAVSRDAAVRPQTVDTATGPDTSRLVSAYPSSVLAPSAWSTATGRGVGVAVIDTGIAGELSDFAGDDGASRVVASVVTNPDATTATDTYGHGTHVAGIIAGDGTRRSADDPLAGQYVGIAPDAHLISIKAGDDEGRATILDAITGLQFAVDHRDELGIRVVNLSLESTTPESYRTDPLDAAVEAAWFHGLVVVAAAGNHGTATEAADYAPGNDPFAITVGAVDDQGTDTLDDDAYATWSSAGRTQDGYVKPEIGAPGAHIVSTLAPGSAFTDLCPDCIVGGAYIRAGGTSMAAPVVSGVAALMLQAHPDWTPDEVKSTILATRRQLPGGVEEVDAAAAVVQQVPATGANDGRVPNDVVDAATGDIDYARSSWSRSSWSTAPDALTAGWARSSWSCVCTPDAGGTVDPTRSSWSRSSWSRSSWSTNWKY
jgi:serine protease AprX